MPDQPRKLLTPRPPINGRRCPRPSGSAPARHRRCGQAPRRRGVATAARAPAPDPPPPPAGPPRRPLGGWVGRPRAGVEPRWPPPRDLGSRPGPRPRPPPRPPEPPPPRVGPLRPFGPLTGAPTGPPPLRQSPHGGPTHQDPRPAWPSPRPVHRPPNPDDPE